MYIIQRHKTSWRIYNLSYITLIKHVQYHGWVKQIILIEITYRYVFLMCVYWYIAMYVFFLDFWFVILITVINNILHWTFVWIVSTFALACCQRYKLLSKAFSKIRKQWISPVQDNFNIADTCLKALFLLITDSLRNQSQWSQSRMQGKR